MNRLTACKVGLIVSSIVQNASIVSVLLMNGMNLENIGHSGETSLNTTVGNLDRNLSATKAKEAAMVRVVGVAVYAVASLANNVLTSSNLVLVWVNVASLARASVEADGVVLTFDTVELL